MARAKQAGAPADKNDKAKSDLKPATHPSPNKGSDASNNKTQTPGGVQSPTQPAAAPRRGPNVKEVIPFEWKLLGVARGAILTLFKSVEREETEAQLERVLRDGYYTNLRIVENDYIINQTAAVKSELKKVKDEQGKKAVTWGSASKASKKSKEKPKPVKTAKKTASVKKTKKVKKVVKAKRVTKAKKAPGKMVSKAATAKKKVTKSTKSKTTKANKKRKKKAAPTKPRKKKNASTRKK